MLRRFLQAYFAFTARIGVSADDSEELRLQKSLMTSVSPAIILAGTVWSMMYFAFGEPIAGIIPGSYAALSVLSIFVFARRRDYARFRFTQLLLILLLPFLLQIALGGFINSSAVILWSLICPIGALIFAGPRQAVRWFALYLLLVVISGFLQTYLRTTNNLSSSLVITFFVLNVGAISAIVFALLIFFINQKDIAYKLLGAEREKSENLLLNILPKEIAEILKNQGGTIADHYDQVSILFADLVNFTPLAAELSPRDMVGLLNQVFSHFDSLVDQCGVEKIETVGDEYMAACGVPRPNAQHAQSVARLALEMGAYMASIPPRFGRRLEIRIGIHSGPIVAGVIGRKKFAFELFGDTVNTANRMQSHGVPGKIQITRATYELLKDEFICEPRGKVMIKGKGEMETWFLVDTKPGVVELK
ncbi:MAG: adenylate/guanylate cyclase domain-containing protein [Chloroflexi bacterium]|nr:adenylate/guanylate cyclase domain-containing protein [Chloroflexota bacterium]